MWLTYRDHRTQKHNTHNEEDEYESPFSLPHGKPHPPPRSSLPLSASANGYGGPTLSLLSVYVCVSVCLYVCVSCIVVRLLCYVVKWVVQDTYTSASARVLNSCASRAPRVLSAMRQMTTTTTAKHYIPVGRLSAQQQQQRFFHGRAFSEWCTALGTQR